MKICRPILDFFMLILRVSSYFAADAIYKSRGLFKAFSQEGFEFVRDWGDYAVAFDPAFVLLLTEENMILQETCCKRYASMPFSFNYFKIILVFLAELVALYV